MQIKNISLFFDLLFPIQIFLNKFMIKYFFISITFFLPNLYNYWQLVATIPFGVFSLSIWKYFEQFFTVFRSLLESNLVNLNLKI